MSEFTLDALGRVYTTTDPVTSASFLRSGIAMNALGQVHVTTTVSATDVWINGMRLSAAGAVVIDPGVGAARPYFEVAGLPFDKRASNVTITQENQTPSPSDPYVNGGVRVGPLGGVYTTTAAAPPFQITDPVINGTPEVGVVTTYTPASVGGAPTPTVTGRQWYIGAAPIAGATGLTYTPITGDIGLGLSIQETWTNSGGSISVQSAPVTVIPANVTTVFDFLGPALPTGFTLTRTGAGATYYSSTGVLTQVAANIPRFDHLPFSPYTPLGILLELTRTNLILNSPVVVTQNITVTAVAHVLSFFGTGTITLSGAATLTLVGIGATPNRVSVVFTPTAGTLTLTVTGSVVQGQLEVGSSISSYIVTGAAAVQRGADALFQTGATFDAWYQTTGSSTLEFLINAPPDGAVSVLLTLGDGVGTNFLRAFSNTSPTLNLRGANAGVNTAVLTVLPTIPLSSLVKMCMTFNGTTFERKGTAQGLVPAKDTLTAFPAPFVKLNIGGSTTNSIGMPGWYRKFTFQNRVLSDAEMQDITTIPATFSGVKRQARADLILSRQVAFLANPNSDLNWAALTPTTSTNYVSATATSGTGTIGNPYSPAQFNQAGNQAADRLWIASGDFRGTNLILRNNGSRLDLRGCTVCRGVDIPFSAVTDLGNNTYAITNPAYINFSLPDVSFGVANPNETDPNWFVYNGLSTLISANAAIQGVQATAADGRIEFRAGWRLNPNERLALTPNGAEYVSPVGPFQTTTPYWVETSGPVGVDINGNTVPNPGTSGIQVCTLRTNATPGVGVISSFSPADQAALAKISDSKVCEFFSLYELVPEAKIPNSTTVKSHEFAFEPWNSRFVFKTEAPLSPSAKLVSMSGTDTTIVFLSGVSNCHILGGTTLLGNQVVTSTSTTNCGMWGTTTYGGYRGLSPLSSSGFTIRYSVSWWGKYNFQAGGGSGTSGSPNTNISWVLAKYSGNWIHDYGDRHPILVNRNSDGTTVSDSMIWNCARQSTLAQLPPYQQIAGTTATFGVGLTDTVSNITWTNVYFASNFGDQAKMNTDPLVAATETNNSWVRCVFDIRDEADTGNLKGWSSWYQLGKGGVTITSIAMSDSLILIGDTPMVQPVDTAGRKLAAWGLSSMASGSGTGGVWTPVMRRNIIYGGSGPEASMYLLQNENDAAIDGHANVDTDFNLFQGQTSGYLYIKASTGGGGTAWGANTTIKDTRVLPLIPTFNLAWTSDGITNDANSRVLSSGIMTIISLGSYDAAGYKL